MGVIYMYESSPLAWFCFHYLVICSNHTPGDSFIETGTFSIMLSDSWCIGGAVRGAKWQLVAIVCNKSFNLKSLIL
jgi:hypothetical protein